MAIEIPKNEPRRANLVVDEFGPSDNPVVRVITEQGWIPIVKGEYRLVFGIPRRLWQFGTTLYESYFYELIEKIGLEEVQEVLKIYEEAGAEPLRAFQIEGQFDPDGVYWHAGAKMEVEQLTGGRCTLTLPDWKFRIYEGDKLYSSGVGVLELSGPSEG